MLAVHYNCRQSVIMDIYVTVGKAHYGEIYYGAINAPDWRAPCTLGQAGGRHYKSEGDKTTPLGRFLLRALYYRPDRWEKPQTAFATHAITPQCGWSDDVHDPDYNQYVSLPHDFSHEKLWRADALYDCFFALGYNDDPIIAGKGSAIFLHLQQNPHANSPMAHRSIAHRPTQGCVAVNQTTMRQLIKHAQPSDALIIQS